MMMVVVVVYSVMQYEASSVLWSISATVSATVAETQLYLSHRAFSRLRSPVGGLE